MKRLRIVMVCHYYPPHLGGIENVAHGEAVRLAAAGHDVTVLTSSPGGAANPRGMTGTTWQDDVRVCRIPAWNGIERRTGVPFPMFSPRLLPAMIAAIRRADVVHVHDSLYLSSWTAALVAWVLRRPIVLTQHVDQIRHPSALVRAVQQVVYGSAGLLVLRTARRVAVLNSRVEAFVAERGVAVERIQLLPNGVDTDLFRPARPGEREVVRTSFNLPEAEIALFVGRFVPKKGFDLLLEAAGERHQLVLAGGEAPPEGERPGRRYVGALTPAWLAELYRAVDVFVLPSEGEGFPLTAQEAMASGLPVVLGDDEAYACYQLDRDLVRFVPRTSTALREVLDELMSDADTRRRMAQYSVQTATTRFSWTAHLAALETMYAQSLGRQKAFELGMPDSILPMSAEPTGAEPVDAEPVDAEPVDAEPVDAEPVDAKPVDAKPVDAEPIGAEPVDAESIGAEAR